MQLDAAESDRYRSQLVHLSRPVSADELLDVTINGDLFEILPYLPANFVDLLVIDPPYNIDKAFNGRKFAQKSLDEYEAWFESWLPGLLKTLKGTASVYICGDWRSSAPIQRIASKYLKVRNRITW